MPPSASVRPAVAGDDAAIAAVLRAAFGRDAEAELVAALQRDGDAMLSLVACDDGGAVAGHILFSPLGVDGGDAPAAALAPLAVAPAWQRRGVGTALVRAGLAACRARGIAVVVVLGDPAFYGRFGFSAAAAAGLAAPFYGPVFQALDLRPGTWSPLRGTVHYASAFGLDPPSVTSPPGR